MESTVKGRIQLHQSRLKVVDFTLVLPLIDNYLSEAEMQSIRQNTHNLAECLWKLPKETNKKFCMAIAGLYPQLFHIYMKRIPEVQETGL